MPEARRYRLGTTGRRWAPSSTSSSSVGGAFKPVVVVTAPGGVTGPAGDGLSGEDAARERQDGESVREERTKDDGEGSREGRDDSEAVRVAGHDYAMAEKTDRDGLISERMAVGEMSDVAMTVESDKTCALLETMADSSLGGRVGDSAMAESIFVGDTEREMGGVGVSVSERTDGSVLMEEVRGESAISGDIEDSTMMEGRASAMSDAPEKETATTEESKEDDAMVEAAKAISAGVAKGINETECAMVNRYDMYFAGAENTEEKSAMAEGTEGDEELIENSSKDAAMAEECTEDNVMEDESKVDDDVMEKDVTDADTTESNDKQGILFPDATMQEGVKEVTMTEECLKDVTMPEESASNFTMPEESMKDAAMPEEGLKDVPMPEESAKDTIMVEENVKDVAMSEEGVKDVPMPEEGVKDVSMPEENVKDDSLSEKRVKDVTMPEECAKDDTMLEERVKDATMSEELEKDATMPKEIAKDVTMSEESVKDVTMPKERVKDATMSEESGKDTVMPEKDVKDAVMSEDGVKVIVMPGESKKCINTAEQSARDATIVAESVKDTTMEEKSVKDPTVTEGEAEDSIVGEEIREDATMTEESGKSVFGRVSEDNLNSITKDAKEEGASTDNVNETVACTLESSSNHSTTNRVKQGTATPPESHGREPSSQAGAGAAARTEIVPQLGGGTVRTDKHTSDGEPNPADAPPILTDQTIRGANVAASSEPMSVSETDEGPPELDVDQVSSAPIHPAASRRRVVSESDSEISMDSSVSGTGSQVSIPSLMGSPVVVRPKKPKRSAFRLSSKKYVRWRKKQGSSAAADKAREDVSVTSVDRDDDRGEDDAASQAGSSVSESSRAESSVSTEPNRYSWRYRPTVDLGVAWLTLPQGRTEEDVWRAVSASVTVPPVERAAAERAAANSGSISAALTRSLAKSATKDSRTPTPEMGDSDRDKARRPAPVVKKLSYTEKLLARMDIDLNPVVRVERLSLQTLSKPQKPTGDLFKLRLSRNANKLSLSRSLAERGKASSLRETPGSSPAARKAKSSLIQAKRLVNSPRKAGFSHPQMRITSTSPKKTMRTNTSPVKVMRASASPSKVRPFIASPASARKVPLSVTVSPQKRPGGSITPQPKKKARVKITPLRPPSKTVKTYSKTPQTTKTSPATPRSTNSRQKQPLRKSGPSNVEVLHCPRSKLIWDGHNFVRPPSPKSAEKSSAPKSPDKSSAASKQAEEEEEEEEVTVLDDDCVSDAERSADVAGAGNVDQPAAKVRNKKRSRRERERIRKPAFAGPKKATARKRTGGDVSRNVVAVPAFAPPDVAALYVQAAQTAMAPTSEAGLSWQEQAAQSVGWMGTEDSDTPHETVDVKPVLESPTNPAEALGSPMRSPLMPLQIELTVPPSPQGSASAAGSARSSSHSSPAAAAAASRRLFNPKA